MPTIDFSNQEYLVVSKRVTILDGGFAGIEAAIHLRKKGIEVTLISYRDYLYIYPDCRTYLI